MEPTEDLSAWTRRLAAGMWGLVGVGIVVETILQHTEWLQLSCLLGWAAALACCGGSYLASEYMAVRTRWGATVFVALLAVEVGAAAYLVRTWGSVVAGFLLVFTAWQAARVWSLRASFLWCTGQTLVLGVAAVPLSQHFMWLGVTLVSGALQGLAVLLAHLARSEAKARVELAQANAELRSMHDLLVRSGRTTERLRLARELHDGMGHRLTALSLNLEAALHQGGAALHESLQRGQAVTRDLLRELRGLVSEMREEPAGDLRRALDALAGGVEKPAITIELEGCADGLDAARTHVAVRCVQEFITNALRNAEAEHVWVAVNVTDAGVLLTVRDDGVGCPELKEGHGLRGLRERVELFRGRLELAPGPPGFAVTVQLPAPGAPA